MNRKLLGDLIATVILFAVIVVLLMAVAAGLRGMAGK